jgi:GTP-binding protein EngB required for normal cell division
MKKMNDNIIFVGNPGSGKSTLLNGLLGRVEFLSGVSKDGLGITYNLQIVKDSGKTYIDTPGLYCIENKKHAGKQIKKALESEGEFRIYFVITLESGRVRTTDLSTIETVLEAIKTDISYNIIINKCSKPVINNKDNYVNILKKVTSEFPKKPSNFYFFENLKDIEDEDDKLIKLNTEFTEFIENSDKYEIKCNEVGDLKLEKMEQLIERFEIMMKNFDEDKKKLEEEKKKLQEEKEKFEEEKKKFEEEEKKKLQEEKKLRESKEIFFQKSKKGVYVIEFPDQYKTATIEVFGGGGAGGGGWKKNNCNKNASGGGGGGGYTLVNVDLKDFKKRFFIANVGGGGVGTEGIGNDGEESSVFCDDKLISKAYGGYGGYSYDSYPSGNLGKGGKGHKYGGDGGNGISYQQYMQNYYPNPYSGPIGKGGGCNNNSGGNGGWNCVGLDGSLPGTGGGGGTSIKGSNGQDGQVIITFY